MEPLLLCSPPSDQNFDGWVIDSPSSAKLPFSLLGPDKGNNGHAPGLSLHCVNPLEDDFFTYQEPTIESDYYPLSTVPSLNFPVGPFDPINTLGRLRSESLRISRPATPPSHCQPSVSPFMFRSCTPFDDCYRLSTPWHPLESDISPVVRSSSVGSPRFINGTPGKNCNASTLTGSTSSSFLERLHATLPSAPSPTYLKLMADPSVNFLSPCRPRLAIDLSQPRTPRRKDLEDTVCCNSLLVSPLTPLTPTTEYSSPRRRPKTRAYSRFSSFSNNDPPKRTNSTQDSPSPVYRSKKARHSNCSPESKPLQIITGTSVSPRNSLSTPSFGGTGGSLAPKFTNRDFPPFVPISADFPMFYRRFPASSFYKLRSCDSTFTLFKSRNPGGAYNAPRWPLDLYTPRFVKGKGTAKTGLCPICVEPAERGGAGAKLWLAMKFSAFKYYHMQYTHGISASTGLPFSPPIAFRHTMRPDSGRKEKPILQEGKCHKCSKWIAVEGIKDIESKVKEIFWWKHAALCHHGSTIPGEDNMNVYELDIVHEQLIQLVESVGI